MEEEKVRVQKQSDDRFKYTTEVHREVNDEGHELSYKQTRRVIKSNFHQDSAPLRSQITEENMNKRVSWINEHTQWRKPKWKRVVWTDEKIFELHPQKGKLYTQLLEGETSEDFPLVKMHQGKKVMIWGAISGQGKIFLDVITETLDAYAYCCFLYQRGLPAKKAICQKSYIFMQDNAPAHRSKLAQLFLEISGIEVLKWPPQSPDLNQIEEVWLWMEMKIKNKAFKNIEELTDYIFETREKTPNDTILRFVEKLSDKMNYILKQKERIS